MFLLIALLFLVKADFVTTDLWSGNNFFDQFDFYTGPDPTHGYVFFASRQQATDWGLITNANPVYMGADHTTVSSGSGRASVRLTSKQRWNVAPGTDERLFIIDLSHMPSGCGTWPAWWFFGPNWPQSGEIDVIEGVNAQTANAITLHTTAGCAISPNQGGFGPGRIVTPNCDVNAPGQWANAGCSISGPANSYGAPFNQGQGGVYAMLWGHDAIKAWFFPRNRIPSDLTRGANSANPDGWGQPIARFNLGGGCPTNHFKDQNMIFDLTFCGDWAGATFGNDCPGRGDCNNFVKNNPGEFREAYWLINFVKVMKTGRGSPPPPPPPPPPKAGNPPPPPSGDYTSLGCGIDAEQRALTGASTTAADMTARKCYDFCKARGFSVFGTEYGQECYCGNNAFSKGKANDADCNMKCGGNANEKCGGSWRLNVYQAKSAAVSPQFCSSRCRINGNANLVCQPPGCPPCKQQAGDAINCVPFNPGTTICPSGYRDCQANGGRLEGDQEPSSGMSTGQTVGIAVGVCAGVLLIVAIVAGAWYLKKKNRVDPERV